MKFYLCELKVNGCKNINKEIDLKFCNSTIKSKVNFENTNVKAIYGPNGAGKSAIVTAMHIYERLICNGNGLNDSYFSNFVKESINKETNKLEIEATVLLYNSKYNAPLYTFKHYIRVIKKNNNVFIDAEKVYKLSGNYIVDDKFKKLIDIEEGRIVEIDGLSNVEDSSIYKKSLNLLDKRSIINMDFIFIDKGRTLDKYEMSIVALNVFAYNIIVSMEKEDLHVNYLKSLEIDKLSNEFKSETSDDDIFNFSVKDRDIVKVEHFNNYLNNIKKLEKFIRVFKADLKSIEVDKKINDDVYYCNKIFHYNNSNGIDIEFESTGIKKLVRLFNALLACTNGKIVFIDEFDANLHDVYFAKLVEFLKNYAKGQLCFTTHNLEPIEVLKNNSYSLDFLSNDSRVASWIKNGNKSPMKQYINGLIDYSPFNVYDIDFIDSLIEEDNING